LFETASEVFKEKLAGILLTGANKDGSTGIKKISLQGGTTIAQQPETADYTEMPRSAINTGFVKHILTPDDIGQFLLDSM
jgi:two-component system chemotaxis response regulator CheB